MTIAGQLQYAAPLLDPMPSGMLGLLGEDGNHYVQAHVTFGALFTLSQIDNEDEPFFTLSLAEAQARLDSLGLSGVVAADWVLGSNGGTIITGTQYFIIPMFTIQFGSPERTVNIWLYYKVNSASTVEFVGYEGGACTGGSTNHGSVGAIGGFVIGSGYYTNPVWGQNVIGSAVYLAMETGMFNFFGTESVAEHVVKLPIPPTNSFSTTSGTWDPYITEMPSTSRTYVNAGTARQYSNRMAVMSEPGGAGLVRVFMYLDNSMGPDVGFSGATLLTIVVNPATNTGDAAWTDCSTIFGIPYADTLYNFAGTLTTNPRNDYTSPTCIGSDVFMIRGFDDALNYARRRLFSIGGAGLTLIQEAAVVNDLYTAVDPSGLNGQIEFIQGYRYQDIFYTMGRFNTQYVFGNMGEYPNVTPEPTPGGGGSGVYYIERMDNRIWPTIEDAWCLDSALELEQPAPDAFLAVSSAVGDRAIRSYNIINGGSGYTSPIGQVFDATGPGSGATVTLSVTGGVIDVATAVTVGSNYKQPAVLSILDATGVGAVIQPLVTNYTTLSTNTSSFTSSDVGSIVRVGGGRIEIISYSSTTSVIGNVISPITNTVPNDPNNTPVVADPGQWTMTMPVTTVSALWHLEGLTVSALADGGVVNDLVVANGSVTLPYSASQVLVGLPFIAQLQTMYLDAGAGPTVQGRRKSNPQVIIRVEQSRPMEIGVNQPDAAAQPNQAVIDWTQMTEVKFRTPSMPAGQPLPLYSGDYEPTNLFGGYDSRGQIAIQQTDPVPLTVLAVVIQTTIGDDPGK